MVRSILGHYAFWGGGGVGVAWHCGPWVRLPGPLCGRCYTSRTPGHAVVPGCCNHRPQAEGADLCVLLFMFERKVAILVEHGHGALPGHGLCCWRSSLVLAMPHLVSLPPSPT